MKIELQNRKISMFRTMYDPAVGPTPRNAFNVHDPKLKMEAHLTPAGVYVKVLTQQKDQNTGELYYPEHLVPFANIQSIKLAPAEPEAEHPETRGEATLADNQDMPVLETKPRGRPKAS